VKVEYTKVNRRLRNGGGGRGQGASVGAEGAEGAEVAEEAPGAPASYKGRPRASSVYINNGGPALLP
jgi:hypothetical protein